MLNKDCVANICLRHLSMPQHGTGKVAMQMMKADFEKSIDRWFAFSIKHQVSAKELIRILKEDGQDD